MYALQVPLAALSEPAAESAGHISEWWYGGFSLVVLIALLALTLILGKGRPHS